jgi:hypothetical protein
MKRAFEIDVLKCRHCGGRLKLKALVMVLQPLVLRPLLSVVLGVVEAHNIERFLRHLGESLEPPRRSPARDPPYCKAKVLRRKLAELN